MTVVTRLLALMLRTVMVVCACLTRMLFPADARAYLVGWLLTAGLRGHTHMVMLLLRARVLDPDVPGHRHGVTALRLAADGGHHDTVRALLAFGADPNRLCRDQWSPLHGAAARVPCTT